MLHIFGFGILIILFVSFGVVIFFININWVWNVVALTCSSLIVLRVILGVSYGCLLKCQLLTPQSQDLIIICIKSKGMAQLHAISSCSSTNLLFHGSKRGSIASRKILVLLTCIKWD